MVQIEDILDDSRSYLFGKMTRKEIRLFEALLKEHLHLVDDIFLMKLVWECFAEQEVEPKNEGSQWN